MKLVVKVDGRAGPELGLFSMRQAAPHTHRRDGQNFGLISKAALRKAE